MLRFEKTSKGFQLFYKGMLVIEHSSHLPCFQIGTGTSYYRRRVGHFKIRDRNLIKIKLEHYKLKLESAHEMVIVFSNSNHELEVTFKITEDYLEVFPKTKDKSINRFWMRISAESNERIYGGGAHYAYLNLRGKRIRLWVEEYLYSTYYPQPTFLSSKNYFCHVETTYYSEFDFSNENYHELHVWQVPEKILIRKFDSMLSVISHLSKYLGHQPNFPDWVYDGVILGIQGGNEIVEKKVNKAMEVGMKISAVWCQDWQGFRITNFGKNLFWNWEYDDSLYPDLPSFIKLLNKRDIKFLGYMNCFLALDGELYKNGSQKGYLVKNEDRKTYDIDVDELNAGLYDLTNPDTIEWIKETMKKNMIDIGLSGWMHDYGEYLPTDARLHSGMSAAEYHNQYAVDWAKIVHEFLIENDLEDEILLFHRCGFSHASKYIMLYWPGDQIVDWTKENGFAAVIPIGITLGLCGIGNYHFDIGGFITMGPYIRSKEIFMRWAEAAAFTMVMRTHEGIKPDKNWQFDSDKECLRHFASMIDVHVHLKPYLKHLSREYQENGIPPMRACFLHYPDDPELHDLKYQYLFGRDLLVAPVIKPKKSKWKVYLPDDNWVHIWTGKKYPRGWHEVDAEIGKPPVFYNKDSEFLELFIQLKIILEIN